MSKSKKPLVVVTRKLPDSVELRMRELFDARLNPDDKPMTHAELAEVVRNADVLVPTVTDRIDASILSKSGERLKLIANFGNGVDNIDVATAVQRGITVTNTPGVLTEDTADMTMALILAVPRRLAEGSMVLTSDKHWSGWTPTWMLGHRIWGKRLGIIGMGRIGQAVARRARAFGLQIHYHNRRRVAPKIETALEATYWESLDQMLARMDIISVNCPHTPATFTCSPRGGCGSCSRTRSSSTRRVARSSTKRNWSGCSKSAPSGARASTSSSTSRLSTRGCGRSIMLCCSRTWARRRSRGGSRWAKR